jgi:hypothetical protein
MHIIRSIPLYIICLFSFLWCSCSNPKSAPETLPAQPPVSALDPSLTPKVVTVLDIYFQLKDALIAEKSHNADEAARNMKAKLLIVKDNIVNIAGFIKKDSLAFDLGVALSSITMMEGALDNILSVKDESCEVKRIYFKPLSDGLYNLLKTIQLKHVTIYHALCPMALNEEGAYWLSQFPEIKNPYFGKKMLTCGEVVDTIR